MLNQLPRCQVPAPSPPVLFPLTNVVNIQGPCPPSHVVCISYVRGSTHTSLFDRVKSKAVYLIKSRPLASSLLPLNFRGNVASSRKLGEKHCKNSLGAVASRTRNCFVANSRRVGKEQEDLAKESLVRCAFSIARRHVQRNIDLLRPPPKTLVFPQTQPPSLRKLS